MNMEKKYKFITIRPRLTWDVINGKAAYYPEKFAGKPVYAIHNNKSDQQIGLISWYRPWKQYVFSSQSECVFNNSCLKDVIDFMENEAGKA
jgi:hypothetical protein